MNERFHTIIIGSGAAGYHAAERLYDLGVRELLLMTEGRQRGTSRNAGSDKQTYYKLSLSGSDGDSVREMAETLYAGGRVMGEHALAEAAYSVRCFMHLVELGVPFPANEFGEYAGYKTDHDPRSRATSAGPLTSRYMTEALEKAVLRRGIRVLDGMRAIRILTDGNAVTGVAAVSEAAGDVSVFGCQNVILCTGGPAGLYRDSVYPESQHGAMSLAILAGASCSNLEEWQYGIASIAFRWNLSGTYEQVLPRYVSVGEDGTEHEFLYEALQEKSLGLIFLKGYQWPFDTRKTDGSSMIDLLVFEELKKHRRVFLDYRTNPKGLESGFENLPREAYDYLNRSGALFGTPIERLKKMNPGAIELYRSHGIDLAETRLEIRVSAQHLNGGVAVDEHWESTVKGLYAAGEAAGTFGVYRPGGSALNATQVGSLRAAEHIAKQPRRTETEPVFVMPKIRFGASNIEALAAGIREGMSTVAAFDRDTAGMKKLFASVSTLSDRFFETAVIASKAETADLFRLYDIVLTARSVLSACILSAEKIGTHGSAMVDRKPNAFTKEAISTRTITVGAASRLEPVSAMPDPELWFETLLNRAEAEAGHGD